MDSVIDKTEQALHEKIDSYINSISRDFNISEEKINEMRENLHARVDTFFDNVNNVLDAMEDKAIQSIESQNGAEAQIPEAETTLIDAQA